MGLSREDILNAQDRQPVVVSVPEWGGDVLVTTMTGADRDAFNLSLVGPDGERNTKAISARLVAFCTVDESGNRIFADEDIEALSLKSWQPIERLAQAIMTLNRLGDAELEDAEKN